MKLMVFGATGTIGRHVVRSALEAGHEVTAFARTVSRLEADFSPLGGALSLCQGNVLSAESVAAAIPGHDGVVVTLGAGARSGLRAPGTANIVNAMQAATPKAAADAAKATAGAMITTTTEATVNALKAAMLAAAKKTMDSAMPPP